MANSLDILPSGGTNYGPANCTTWQRQADNQRYPQSLWLSLRVKNYTVEDEQVILSLSANWSHNAYLNTVAYEFGYYVVAPDGTPTVPSDIHAVVDGLSDRIGLFKTTESEYNSNQQSDGSHLWKRECTITIPRTNSKQVILPFFKLGGIPYNEGANPWPGWEIDGAGILEIQRDTISQGYESELPISGYNTTFLAIRIIAGEKDGDTSGKTVSYDYGFEIPAKTKPTTPTLSIKWSENNYYPDNLNWTYGVDQIGQDGRVAPIEYNLYVANNENMYDKQTIWNENQNITNINNNDSYVPDFINMEPGQQLWYQIVVFDENDSVSYSNIKGPIFTSPTAPTDQEISDSGMSPKSGYSKGGTIAEGSVPTTSGDEDAGFGWMACLNSTNNEKKPLFEIKKNTTLDRIIVVPYNYIRQNNVTVRAFNEDAFYILPDIYIPWINISYTF